MKSVLFFLLLATTSLLSVTNCSSWNEGSDVSDDPLDAVIVSQPDSFTGSNRQQSGAIPYANLETLSNPPFPAGTSPIFQPVTPHGASVGSSVRIAVSGDAWRSTAVLPWPTEGLQYPDKRISGSAPSTSTGFAPYPTDGAPYENKTSQYNSPSFVPIQSLHSFPPNLNPSTTQQGISDSFQSSGLGNQCPPPQTVTLPPSTMTLSPSTLTLPPLTVTLPAETVTVTAPAQAQSNTLQPLFSTVYVTVAISTAQAASCPSASNGGNVQPDSAQPHSNPVASAPVASDVPSASSSKPVATPMYPTPLNTQGAGPDKPATGGGNGVGGTPSARPPDIANAPASEGSGGQSPTTSPVEAPPIKRPFPQSLRRPPLTENGGRPSQPVVPAPAISQPPSLSQRPPFIPSALSSATAIYGNLTGSNGSSPFSSGTSTGFLPSGGIRTGSSSGPTAPIGSLRLIGTVASRRLPMPTSGLLKEPATAVTERSSIYRLPIPFNGSIPLTANASNAKPAGTGTEISTNSNAMQPSGTGTEMPGISVIIQPSQGPRIIASSTYPETNAASASVSKSSGAPPGSPPCLNNLTSHPYMTADVSTFPQARLHSPSPFLRRQ
ncbi:MAG: hypothetical protein Q9217_007036 [Psora testacea]